MSMNLLGLDLFSVPCLKNSHLLLRPAVQMGDKHESTLDVLENSSLEISTCFLQLFIFRPASDGDLYNQPLPF